MYAKAFDDHVFWGREGEGGLLDEITGTMDKSPSHKGDAIRPKSAKRTCTTLGDANLVTVGC